MNRIDGKVALVTGGGAGIGRACCELLSKAGAQVVVSDIDKVAAEETVKSIVESNGEAIAINHDVSREGDWRKVISTTLGHFKKLDILVNNAGIWSSPGFINTSLEDWRIT